MGLTDLGTVQRVELLIKDFGLELNYRNVVEPAREASLDAQKRDKGSEGIYCGAAIALKDGTIVTGSNSTRLHAASSLILHAATNPAAQIAVEKLNELRGCEVHMTHMPTPGDEAGLRRLGVNLTSDPNFSTKDLFIS